jgi:hypothetical protein
MLKRTFGPKRKKWWEIGIDCIMKSFITCTLHQILLGFSNQGSWDGWAMYYVWDM